MEKLELNLQNCHGIRELKATFDFTQGGNAVAIYAPNGTMKTSLATTFNDLATGSETSDRMFPERETLRGITNESGEQLSPEDVIVVSSYDEELGPTEATSALLVNRELQQEYDSLQADLNDVRQSLVSVLKSQSNIKLQPQDIVEKISICFTQSKDNFFTALVRIAYEVEQQEDAPFADVNYDVIFNPKVRTALSSPDLQEALATYVTRLNEVLDESTYFGRTGFNFYHAGKVTRSLAANKFFEANHRILLNGSGEDLSIESHEELLALVRDEKARIAEDPELRSKLLKVEAALQKNEDTRNFYDYVASRVELLPEFQNLELFEQRVWKSFLKANEAEFRGVVDTYKDTEVRRKEIQRQAAAESTTWEKVIEIFNERFFVPFRLVAKNKYSVALGQEKILELGFEFEDGEDSASVPRHDLLKVLSNGEKKALYILNVLFLLETRKNAGSSTLFIVDDLADSFDYKNKYAIVQYLKEMANEPQFRLLLLTHNFDFFRTLKSRGVTRYQNCFMAQKAPARVVLRKAEYVDNPFIKEFKRNFFTNGMQRVASVPFMRNVIEYTKSSQDPDYLMLTSLLHLKGNSESVKHAQVDEIFTRTFTGFDDKAWASPSVPFIDSIFEQAEIAAVADEGVNFENKIVLAMAIRLLAEKFMIAKLDAAYVSSISSNQTLKLFEKCKELNAITPSELRVLDNVMLMTPENIHVNSFMYEPIIDMSDSHLRDLYAEVRGMAEEN